MNKLLAQAIVVGFVSGTSLATASTFAHADHKEFWIQRPDDHGNLYWYPDYIAQDNHDRSHARQQHETRRWKKHRRQMRYEQRNYYYDEPYYQEICIGKKKFRLCVVD